MSIYVTQQPLPYFVGRNWNKVEDRYAPVSGFSAFSASSPPTDGTVDGAVTLGVEFYVTEAADLVSILWWNPTTNSDGSAREAALFNLFNTQLTATATGAVPSAPGWQTITLASPFTLTPMTRYRAGVFHPVGGYATSAFYFDTLPDIVNGPLTVPGGPNSTDAVLQGTFTYDAAIASPTSSFHFGNYWTDVVVTAT